jgi:16S rRNA (adenine1518-N6/adenine1519-N6)-dimethyltransferase
MNNLKSDILKLPSLRSVTKTHNLMPRKSLGQNFIFDLNLTSKIARAAAPFCDGTVIEIGPGPGGLTRAILLEGAKNIISVEKDTRAIRALGDLVKAAKGKLTLIQGDAMKLSIHSIGFPPRRIIANLPYNIATGLIIDWLRTPNAFESITVMVQKEVAIRMCAEPGDSGFGRLAIIIQWLAIPEILFDVPPSAFQPSPKVTSTLIKIRPLPRPQFEVDRHALEIITSHAFGQRRKMLRSSLRNIGGHILLEKANIQPTQRPENLTIKEFCQLAQAYTDMKQSTSFP